MKQRRLQISLFVKMLVLFTLVFGVLTAASFQWFYDLATRMALDDVARELSAIAEAVASRINGDEYEALVNSDLPGVNEMIAAETPDDISVTNLQYWGIEDERYRRIVDTLDVFKRLSGTVIDLEGTERSRLGIYTYVGTEQQGVVNFIASASAIETPPRGARFRAEYVTNPATETRNFMWEGLTQTSVNVYNAVSDSWGTFYSGFAPIRNSEGNIVGAVGVDMADTTVLEAQQRIRDAFIPAVAVIAVVVFASVFITSYSISRPIVSLTRAARRVAEGDYSEGVIPPVRGILHDETAMLTGVFQMMVDKVRQRTESLQQKITELQIIVDETKKDQHVREIVDSDFFRELQSKSAQMRNRVRQKDTPSGS